MAVCHSLLAFQQRFPDEAHCAQFLLERRWPDGFVCPGCGGKRGHLLRSRAYTYECVACGKQTSVTAGTVMHKLPLTVWFWAAHLMATHSNGMSAQQLMGQLGSYKTAWLLAQKLRRSMVDPEREPLKGVVEIDQSEMPFRADETFFEITKSGKMLVIGAVEIVDHTKPQEPKRFGAKYLDTMSGRWPRSRATRRRTSTRSSRQTLRRARHWCRTAMRPIWGSRTTATIPAWSAAWQGTSPSNGSLRPLEAVEPRHLPPPPTHRFVPERIRLPLQPTILSTCLVRDRAWLGDAPRAGSLLGHHRAEKPSQSFPDNQATATPSQDSQRISSGRRTHLKLGRSVSRR